MRNASAMLFVLALAALVCAPAPGQSAKYFESFEDGVPDYFTATRPGSLSTGTWHCKHGEASLRWDWRKGEELTIRQRIGDVTRTGGFLNRASFSVWLYVEQPVADALLFEFREGDKVTGSFRFPLQFTGWRQGRLFYDGFPQGQPTSAVDNIRIIAPSGVARGRVFFDFIKYNTLTYFIAGPIIPEEIARRRRPIPDEQRFPRPEQVTEAELAGISQLKGAPAEAKGLDDARVSDLIGKLEALGIVRDRYGVRGPGLDSRSYFVAAPGQYGGKDVRYWPDELGPDAPEIHGPAEVVALANQIGNAYLASDDVQQRTLLADAFLLVADYLDDQGETLDMPAVVRMAEVLEDSGRLEPHLDGALRRWGGDDFFVEGDSPVRSNMDFYSYFVDRLLTLSLVHTDPRELVRWLNAWKAMLERSILQPQGALKIDGSSYHHGGHYHSYAHGAFPNFVKVFRRVADTPWRLSPEAHARLSRAMLAQRIYCNKYDRPLSLCGRSPFVRDIGGILPYGVQALDDLARFGTPDGTQAVDPEVAAVYLRLAPEAVSDEPYFSLGMKPEADPYGTFVMPYAGLLCHRRDNWLVSVKGQSRYVWGSERQARRNCYGLFLGLGHLEVLAGDEPVSLEGSGYEQSGWDWARFEGTTVPQLPLQRLEQGWASPGTERSQETFVGGLSHLGYDGIFAMVMNQPIMPATTLTGNKSWFFFDDLIICLGSNIHCDEAEYPTQTTLCQKALRPNEEGHLPATVLDGAQFTGLPEQRELPAGAPHWLIDVQQTGYYVPPGHSVVVARREQTSRDVSDLEDTRGSFLVAWIDHGTSPSDASYEYMVVVKATPEAMQEYCASPPYQVVERSSHAHIVRHTAASKWGCVFFVPQQVTPHVDGSEVLPVQAVDQPCLVMAGAIRDGRLQLSVADPDLNLQDGGNQPRPMQIELRGAWRLAEVGGRVCAWELEGASDHVSVVASDADRTVLEIVCQHGASYDISLAREM